MSLADKRSTLIEMGYAQKNVQKMKPAEIDGIITGQFQAEIRRARINGMDVDEARALPLAEKRAFLRDLGIDDEDLGKLGNARLDQLFNDVTALSRQPGSHKVKAKIKGGLD